MIRRFTLLVFLCLPFVSVYCGGKQSVLEKQFSALEKKSSGRLGLYAIDTETGVCYQYHGVERFPLCSTSKVMAVSAILKRSEFNRGLLQQLIKYRKYDSSWSPVTKKHLQSGMTIAQLCRAAITQSDNTAMNLLMKQLGGPKVVTAFARSIGDDKFRLDRKEPDLSSGIPGDQRDTTTPRAMAKSLRRLVLGHVLALPQRKLLLHWLINNKTGNARIRAGVPKGWLVADKTGTGGYGTTNDIALIFPPGRLPIVLAIYYTQNKKDAAMCDGVIASATSIVVGDFVSSFAIKKVT